MKRTALLFIPMSGFALDALPPIDVSIFRDPVMRRQLAGKLGVAPDVEPKIERDEERLVQEQFSEMLGRSDTANATRLLDDTLRRSDLSAPGRAYFAVSLATIHLGNERVEPALIRLREAIEKFPNFRRAWELLGRVQAQRGQHEDAIKAMTKAIELGAKDGPLFGILGLSYLATDRTVSAESAFRSAMLFEPDNLGWKSGLARVLYKQSKFPEAAALFGEMIAKDQRKAEFWTAQSAAYLAMKDSMRAAQNFEIMRLLGIAKADNLLTLGDIYQSEGLFDLAGATYERAFDLDAGLDLTRPIRAADFLARASAYDSAKGLLARIKAASAKLDAEQRKKLLKIEARIASSTGATGEYAKILELTVAEDPLDGRSLLDLAKLHEDREEMDKAIFWYERAEGLKDFEADATFRHGYLLVKRNRFDEALKLLRRSNELKPRDELKDYIAKVERMAKVAK